MTEEIILIEFRKRKPFSVFVTSDMGYADEYDVEWSRLYKELYYDMCGGSPFPYEHKIYRKDTLYWLNPEFENRVTVTGGRRIKSSK